MNIAYVFKPGTWLALDAGYGTGGAITISGVTQEQQKNTRLGLALALPLDAKNLLRFVYVSGIATRLGADFDTFGAGYVRRWRVCRNKAPPPAVLDGVASRPTVSPT